MANPFFKFKQFTVHHDECAMKVGMDGSLLGAWAGNSLLPKRILDIGTGTGLIALMCAQRFPNAHITAVEIQSNCAGQARKNVEDSPFKDRIEVRVSSVQDFPSEHMYDLIVCNPPFFKNSSRSGQLERDTARHDDSLPFSELAFHASRLLHSLGTFSLIIPADRSDEFVEWAKEADLFLHEIVYVRGRVGGSVKRCLMEFKKNAPRTMPISKELSVEVEPKKWTEEYINLLRDFYIVL